MKKAIAVALLAAGLGGAHAALSTDGLTVTDTSSGLQWLRFDQTIGKTFNQLSALDAPGGALAGWRLATLGQVQSLALELGFPLCEDCYGQFNAQWASFSTLFGSTTTPATNVWAITGDRIAFAQDMHPLVHFSAQSVVDDIVDTSGYEGFGDGQLVYGTTPVGLPDDGMVYNIRIDGTAVPAAGAFMVRAAPRDALAVTAPVSAAPEPSTYGLLLGGMLALAYTARRKGILDSRIKNG